jgi:hypothetical protein
MIARKLRQSDATQCAITMDRRPPTLRPPAIVASQHGSLAMQKVEGSSPFIRFQTAPLNGAFCRLLRSQHTLHPIACGAFVPIRSPRRGPEGAPLRAVFRRLVAPVYTFSVKRPSSCPICLDVYATSSPHTEGSRTSAGARETSSRAARCRPGRAPRWPPRSPAGARLGGGSTGCACARSG